MREEGFYFVSSSTGCPTIAEWSSDLWFLAGVEGGFQDKEYFVESGPIIFPVKSTTPDTVETKSIIKQAAQIAMLEARVSKLENLHPQPLALPGQ